MMIPHLFSIRWKHRKVKWIYVDASESERDDLIVPNIFNQHQQTVFTSTQPRRCFKSCTELCKYTKVSFKESLFTYLQRLQAAILGIQDQVQTIWMKESWNL